LEEDWWYSPSAVAAREAGARKRRHHHQHHQRSQDEEEEQRHHQQPHHSHGHQDVHRHHVGHVATDSQNSNSAERETIKKSARFSNQDFHAVHLVSKNYF